MTLPHSPHIRSCVKSAVRRVTACFTCALAPISYVMRQQLRASSTKILESNILSAINALHSLLLSSAATALLATYLELCSCLSVNCQVQDSAFLRAATLSLTQIQC